jgi:hypothetical protein
VLPASTPPDLVIAERCKVCGRGTNSAVQDPKRVATIASFEQTFQLNRPRVVATRPSARSHAIAESPNKNRAARCQPGMACDWLHQPGWVACMRRGRETYTVHIVQVERNQSSGRRNGQNMAHGVYKSRDLVFVSLLLANLQCAVNLAVPLNERRTITHGGVKSYSSSAEYRHIRPIVCVLRATPRQCRFGCLIYDPLPAPKWY